MDGCRGVHVGNFFLAEKEGGREFTSEDEEVLVLFASQAATAIANARTHRDEQRARADLEALVDTSPVGVVVFDARTGRPVSFNREARRIVGGLRSPDSTAEQLLAVMICRRGDGREIRLDELSLADELRNAETVRAEEIELSVPDGRSVTTLVNATPIHSAHGTVESVVVTVQDLAPLEELERLRAEFLDMVSHELRAPLTSIKGSAATALNAKPDLDPAEMRRRAEPEPYRLGGLEIHYEERRVSVAGRAAELTATEYELLRVLSRTAGRVSTYHSLLRQVWGGATTTIRSWCAPSSRSSGASSATTRPAPPTSSTNAGSATAWPGRATRESLALQRNPPKKTR